jgi:hypothetical protein
VAMAAEAVSSMQRPISKSTNAREVEVGRAVDARTMSWVFAMPRCKMIEAVRRSVAVILNQQVPRARHYLDVVFMSDACAAGPPRCSPQAASGGMTPFLKMKQP